MEQAKQQLKDLMNEMFVEDLKKKFDGMSNDIKTDFQCAVDDFTKSYTDLDKPIDQINDSIKNINESFELKFTETKEELNEKHKILQSSYEVLIQNISDTKNKIITEVNNGFGNQENKNMLLHSDLEKINSTILNNTNQMEKKIDDKSENVKSLVSEVSSYNLKVKEEIKDILLEFQSSMGKQFADYNEVFSTKLNKLTKYNIILFSIAVIEMVVLLFIVFKK